MTNLILASALCLTLAAPTAGEQPQRPAPPPQGTIIISLLPGEHKGGIPAAKSDQPNYAVEGTTQKDTAQKTVDGIVSADEIYEQMKAKLDEKFERMFKLKAELDKAQEETANKWNEYYAMRNMYEKQLKRIIADWTFNKCL